MAMIHVDAEAVKKLYNICRQSLELVEDAGRKISAACAQSGHLWKGDRYKQLDGIAGEFSEKAGQAAKQLGECMIGLYQSMDIESGNASPLPASGGQKEYAPEYGYGLRDPDAPDGGNAPGCGDSADQGPSVPPFTGLAKTQTGHMTKLFKGNSYKVYNTPEESALKNAIELQGSAFPNEFLGTCGCCASGALMNTAGFSFTEGDVVSYAAKNYLCVKGRRNPGENGGTTPNDRSRIIKGMSGIQCIAATGLYTLEELADLLETGRGVILSVDASGLPTYSCPPGSGHAVFLASVVRSSETNRIEGYYIYDSNGKKNGKAIGRYDVCQYIPAETLEMCYEAMGCRVNITEQIIR